MGNKATHSQEIMRFGIPGEILSVLAEILPDVPGAYFALRPKVEHYRYLEIFPHEWNPEPHQGYRLSKTYQVCFGLISDSEFFSESESDSLRDIMLRALTWGVQDLTRDQRGPNKCDVSVARRKLESLVDRFDEIWPEGTGPKTSDLESWMKW